MTDKIKILDATLRDGGLGLDDLFGNGFADKKFSEESKRLIIDRLTHSNIDIVEIGSINPKGSGKEEFAIYKNIEDLSKQIPSDALADVLYAGLYNGPNTPIEDIPDWNPELVKAVRVVLRYSALEESLDFCRQLARKNYSVFVQPALTMRYSDEEIDRVVDVANEINAYACYFVDSHGYMDTSDVKRLFNRMDQRLNRHIPIGFHGHNNMNLAYANAKYLLSLASDRTIILDACATGMGQGAGNLQTELIVPFVNQTFGKDYDYDAVLDVCEILERELMPTDFWGYSVTRLLPAVYHTAYKYGLIMRNRYKLSFRQMNNAILKLTDEERLTYSQKAMDRILKEID